MAGRTNGKKLASSVREIIGRNWKSAGTFYQRFESYASVDQTISDFRFWDRFRRGQALGYELSGLFAAPITEIIAGWVMGDGFTAKVDDDYTDDLLAQFVKRVNATLLAMVTDSYALGDQFIITNPDGSWSIPSPDTVKVDYDLLDYRTPIAYNITTKLDKATVTDQYRLDGRTITVKTSDMNIRLALLAAGWQNAGNDKLTLEFENLIGRIPVVHFANDRSNNETNGRPIYERLLRLFGRYDDLLNKMIDGAQLMGNPIPVFEGMEDVDATIDANGTPTDETYTDPDGNERQRTLIEFDTLAALFLGAGGSFKFASPGVGFTDDIRNTLKVLFLLMLETTRVPEVVWGNEQSGQLSTGNEQMKTFYSFINARRVMLEGQGASDDLGFEATDGLLALFDIWLKTMALTNSRIKVAPVAIEWPELSNTDMRLILDWAKAMHDAGVLTDETFVELSQLVDDPTAEAEAAREEREARMPVIPEFEDPVINEDGEEVEDGDLPTPEAEDEKEAAAA